MAIQDLIEARIQEAMAAGAFDNLRGQGKPLRISEQDQLAGDDALGYLLLNNGGYLPEWLLLAKEIERGALDLDGLLSRFADWVSATSATGEWERQAPALRRMRASIEAQARALRKKQDRFNFDAPSIALERPAIWTEHLMERANGLLREAGAPDWLIT